VVKAFSDGWHSPGGLVAAAQLTTAVKNEPNLKEGTKRRRVYDNYSTEGRNEICSTARDGSERISNTVLSKRRQMRGVQLQYRHLVFLWKIGQK